MRVEDLQQLLDTSPLHTALGLKVRLAADELVLHSAPGPAYSIDGGAFVHGGVIATILDAAATFSLINATGTDWSTVDLRIDYLRSAPVGDLKVTGRAAQVGKRLGRAGAEVTEAGTHRLLASAVGTFVRSA